MVRDQEKLTEKGKFGPYTHPFLAAPLTGTLGVLGLAGWSKCPKRLPSWGLPSVTTRHCKTAEQAHHLLHTGHVIHSHKNTVQLVKKKMCILRKQRD